jgi:TldD protein
MKRAALVSLVVVAVAAPVRAETPPESSVVIRALRDEVKRSTEDLVLPGSKRPYYVGYRLVDQRSVRLASSFGALTANHPTRTRVLHTDVRVGDYSADSGSFVASLPWVRSSSYSWIPTEDAYDVVRRAAWLGADESYKRALDAFDRKLAIRASRERPTEQVDDFSREPVTHVVDGGEPLPLDASRFESLVKALSAVGRDSPSIQASTAHLTATSSRRTFVSSEGSLAVELQSELDLNLVLRAQADDGMKLAHVMSVASCSPTNMPSTDTMLAEAKRIAAELDEIRRAPIVEDYTGPVLFEGPAAPQILEQVIADDLSGTPAPLSNERRFRDSKDSELAGKVGQRVLPAGFTLEDDPHIERVGQLPLAGCYKTDDEGVPAQKVTLIDDGIFKGFVMSRTPRSGFPHSNGHGRARYDGVRGEVANLVLSVKNGRSSKDLRARLLAAAKAARLPYAIVVRLLADHRTRDAASEMPSDDSIASLVMWKVTLDGKEERVRGGRIGSVPLQALKEVLAAGDTPAVASHTRPTTSSVVAPALLFKELVIKKPREPSRKVPVAPRPDLGR